MQLREIKRFNAYEEYESQHGEFVIYNDIKNLEFWHLEVCEQYEQSITRGFFLSKEDLLKYIDLYKDDLDDGQFFSYQKEKFEVVK